MSRRYDDAGTMVASSLEAVGWPESEALVARATLALAHLPAPADGPGFRLFWEAARGSSMPPPGAAPYRGVPPLAARAAPELAFASLLEGGHAVVGRHSRADVRLEHPAISLRHLLLRARRDGSGALTLVGTDLGGALPFFVGPGLAPVRSFTAAGPTVVRLGDTSLVALPHGVAPGTAPPDESALRVAIVDADPDAARPIPRALTDLALRTMVSSISRTLVRPSLEPLPVEVLPREVEARFARVAMRGPHGRVVVDLTREQLERVVLVGRYPRCRVGDLSPFSGAVSRVHAGLVVEGQDLLVLDLASTNGLGGGASARAVRVRTRGSVRLGPEDRLDIELTG